MTVGSTIREDGILSFDPVGQFGTVRSPRLYAALQRDDRGTEGIGLAIFVARG